MSLLLLFPPPGAPTPPSAPLVITLARRPASGSPARFVFGGSDDAIISATQDIPVFSSAVLLSAPAGTAAEQSIPAFVGAASAKTITGVTSTQVVPAFGNVVSASATVSTAPAQIIPAFVGAVSASIGVSADPVQIIPAFDQLADFATTVKRRFSLAQTIPGFSQSATARDTRGYRRTARTYDVPGQDRTTSIGPQARTCAFWHQDRRFTPAPQIRAYQE